MILEPSWKKCDYDLAHIGLNYRPECVRDKCKTGKSLAIAHGLVDLYVQPEAQPKKPGGRKVKGN